MEDATIGFFAESTYAAVFFLVPIFRILIPRNYFIVLLFFKGRLICIYLAASFVYDLPGNSVM